MAENEDKDQKTEDASPRRRQEAREKGQVPLSSELVAALLLVGWAGALVLFGGDLARATATGVARALESLGTLGTRELSLPESAALVSAAAGPVASTLLLLLAPLFAFGLVAAYGQIGFLVAPKAIEADGAKLDPVKNLGKVFALRSVVRTLLAAAKIGLIAGVMGLVAWGQVPGVVKLAGGELGPALAGVGHVLLRATVGALLAILALALIDTFFQRRQHERDLRMSKQELKEEHKATEGDPAIRARIRRVQREMASRRMMADVPKATVVVTNPTHYAVALRYERPAGGAPGGAPRVVAKGVDDVAQRIKQVARDAGVVLYEDVPLARALHAQVEIGDEIPVDLYKAVAGVLAYVYRVRDERSRGLAAAGA